MAGIEVSVTNGSGLDSDYPVNGQVVSGTATAAITTAPMQGANTRVTAGGPAPGQTQKNYSGTVALSASPTTVALETVTAAKQYLITDIIVTINGSTGQTLTQLQFGATNVVNAHVNTTKGIEMIGLETGPIASAGTVVQLVFAAASGATAAYNVFGVEF